MIRLFNLNSEHRYAQLEKKELGYDCARPFKDRLERMNCVNEPGWSWSNNQIYKQVLAYRLP